MNIQKREELVRDIARLPSVALPPLCLPDIHIKTKTEAPCSFVVATAGTIIPQLTAPSVGCGMGLVATSLTRADITPKTLQQFYTAMRDHLGPRYGFVQNILLWFGSIKRPHNKYDLSLSELAEAISHGAQAAQKKYGLSQDTLAHVEYGGNVMSEEIRRAFPPHAILPRSAWISGRHDIGYGFKGNHFLEVQYVEDIRDQEIARAWGLTQGKIVIMYHGGGGAVSHYLGRYFANRKKDDGLKTKLLTFLAKLLFHFASIDGMRHARERWRYYMRPKKFQAIAKETYEGQRLWASITASLNYSYAFRLGIVKRITDAAHAAWGVNTQVSLVWDTIHNSIMEETIHGTKLIVHRHTATRAFDGKPVIISGYNTTNSYIGIGLPHAEEHLFSADHGAGESIKEAYAVGHSQPHPEKHTTTIYTSKQPFEEVREHITNEGLEAVTRPLEEAGVMRPVALLRPIAVFKG